MRSYLTDRQVEVLRLLARGLSVDEVARLLGTSRSNVYHLVRAAREAVERSRNTLRVYSEIVGGGVLVHVGAGTPLSKVAEAMIDKADEVGVKVRLTSAELLVRLLSLLRSREPSCLDMERLAVGCELVLRVDGDGVYLVRAGRPASLGRALSA